ncbi:hypothetical protein [uncultured Lentibacter sp.]|uniref:hypothetical protein n=1 Tax=uncultured Lentibacter sp. TaxID=1659309 RepID=UPI00261F1230|nr:hypothetical protein [uncultured Lentibacter sp.]
MDLIVKVTKIFLGILIILFGITMTGFLAFQGWLIATAVVNGAKTLEPTVYVPLVVTLTTASLGLGATLYSQARTRRQEIESAFRERKIEIYLDFLNTLKEVFLAEKKELNFPKVKQSELVVKLIEVRTKAVLWGSTGVLQALSEFSKVSENNPRAMLSVVDRLQREMRKDLGLSNSGLEEEFFTKLILSNPEELEQISNSAK